jgi:hypothetical protein
MNNFFDKRFLGKHNALSIESIKIKKVACGNLKNLFSRTTTTF